MFLVTTSSTSILILKVSLLSSPFISTFTLHSPFLLTHLTPDYLNVSPTLIQNSKNAFDAAVQGASPAASKFLLIGHDIHQQTAYNLTDYLLSRMKTLGFGTSVTVGQCLGDPSANWYRSAGRPVLNRPANKANGV
jgi:hypothetical protein